MVRERAGQARCRCGPRARFAARRLIRGNPRRMLLVGGFAGTERFAVHRRLGTGGSAEVLDRQRNATVALKTLAQVLAAARSGVEHPDR
jgi:hypothetical protein